MEVIAIGTDIVEVERMKTFLKRETLLKRTFTEEERAYCLKHKDPLPYFAGHYAAKESVIKVLGEGSLLLIGSIEVCHRESGAPYLELTGEALKLLHKKGMTELKLTISHEKKYAVAFVIGGK